MPAPFKFDPVPLGLTPSTWHAPLAWPKQWLTEREQSLVTGNLGLAGAVATRYLRGRRDNEDLMSEATLGLCRASLRYDEKQSKFSTFGSYGALYSINYYLKRQRKHQRVLLDCDAPTDCGIETQPDVDTDDQDRDASILRAEQLDMIRMAMEGLSPREAGILESRLNGETLEAIGQRLGVCKERVRQLEGRAREHIRATIGRKAGTVR